MLRISKLADYGVSLVVFLASNSDHSFNAKKIAQATHINLPTVSKLLKKLANAGLLESIRGISGGYILKKSSRDINIADIISALESNHGLTECIESDTTCQLSKICIMKKHWQIINNTIYKTLSEITIQSLVESLKNSGT